MKDRLFRQIETFSKPIKMQQAIFVCSTANKKIKEPNLTALRHKKVMFKSSAGTHHSRGFFCERGHHDRISKSYEVSNEWGQAQNKLVFSGLPSVAAKNQFKGLRITRQRWFSSLLEVQKCNILRDRTIGTQAQSSTILAVTRLLEVITFERMTIRQH